MKNLFFISLVLFGLSAQAAENEVVAQNSVIKLSSGAKLNEIEAGFQLNSIKNGSLFSMISISREFFDNVDLGARTLLPTNYSDNNAVFMGQLFVKPYLLTGENEIFLEGALSLGVFNSRNYSNAFTSLGAAIGYNRQLTEEFKVGFNMGVDYSPEQITESSSQPQRSIYNKLTINGGFIF